MLAPARADDEDAHQSVIPGRRAAASPEPMNTGLWNMDSGFGLAGRPGMTELFVTRIALVSRLR